MKRHIEITFKPKHSPEFTINQVDLAAFQPQMFVKFQVEKQVSSEPNNASLEIYGMNEEHASALDFKFDLFANIFGAQVIIKGGFIEDGVATINQMYTGVITQSLTTFEAPERITRIEIKNILYELMRRPVVYQASEGQLKADMILDVIKQAGGFIESGQEKALRENLGGYSFDEDEEIKGTLESVTSRFTKGLPRRVVIFWDDAGVSFDPLGIPSKGRPVKFVSEETGLIGTPNVSVSGLSYDSRLDATYRINDPVVVISDVTNRLSLAAIRTIDSTSTDTSGIVFSGTTVVSKIIHVGDNREGDFKTSVETKFIDLIKQAVGNTG